MFTTVYTCPAGKTAIIKDIRVSALNGAVSRVAVFVDSGSERTGILDQALSNLETIQRQGFMVLEPGDELVCLGSGNGAQVWASGAELLGVAP